MTVLDLLADLVRINSINPSYDLGRPERDINAFIADRLAREGIEARWQDVLPDRPNLIAILPGRTSERRIVFEAHVDTASITGMTIPPFEPRIENGRLYGRGSCDTKAGLAAMLYALIQLKREGITPPAEIWVVCAADEEYSFRGVARLCETLTAHAAVVSEPTENRLVIASKGCLRWKIHTRGVAAHSSKPHLGVNAIRAMSHVVLALEDQRFTNSHPLVGPATCNVGIIRGGVQVNFVPDHCEIEVDRRLIPGENIRDVYREYETLVRRLGAAMDSPMLEDEPLDTPPGAPVVQLASSVLRSIGLNPEPVGVPYGSDASKLSQAGVPSILFGPGSIDQAHAAVEYVDCGQVEQAVAFYRGMMEAFA